MEGSQEVREGVGESAGVSEDDVDMQREGGEGWMAAGGKVGQ